MYSSVLVEEDEKEEVVVKGLQAWVDLKT